MQIDTPAVLRRIEIRLAEIEMPKQAFYEKSGISSGSYSQWNTGMHSPSLKKLQKAALVLGVPVEYLLYGDSAPAPLQAEKKERPADGETLVSDLPEVVQELIQLCLKTPSLVPAFVDLARQIEKGLSARE